MRRDGVVLSAAPLIRFHKEKSDVLSPLAASVVVRGGPLCCHDCTSCFNCLI